MEIRKWRKVLQDSVEHFGKSRIQRTGGRTAGHDLQDRFSRKMRKLC